MVVFRSLTETEEVPEEAGAMAVSAAEDGSAAVLAATEEGS